MQQVVPRVQEDHLGVKVELSKMSDGPGPAVDPRSQYCYLDGRFRCVHRLARIASRDDLSAISVNSNYVLGGDLRGCVQSRTQDHQASCRERSFRGRSIRIISGFAQKWHIDRKWMLGDQEQRICPDCRNRVTFRHLSHERYLMRQPESRWLRHQRAHEIGPPFGIERPNEQQIVRGRFDTVSKPVGSAADVRGELSNSPISGGGIDLAPPATLPRDPTVFVTVSASANLSHSPFSGGVYRKFLLPHAPSTAELIKDVPVEVRARPYSQ